MGSDGDERTDLYLGFGITSVFEVVLLALIRTYWMTGDRVEQVSCPQTKIGQEMYRIIIFYFLIVALFNIILETLWGVMIKTFFKNSRGFFSLPEFDISRNTANLIYCQVQ